MEDYADQMQRCRDYVKALQEERRKIQVFHRELPLSIELVTQAIDACRQQLETAGRTEYFPGRSDSSEQTSSEEGPVLEEFIPLKRSSSSSEEEEESEHHPKSKDRNDKPLKKIDWLRSVQLWNTNPDPSPKQVQFQDQTEKKASVIETDKIGGAFHPFQRSVATIPSSGQKISASPTTTTTTTTTTTNTDTEGNGGVSDNNEGGGSGKREEKDGQSQRKPRRSWSPELHRRFLNALQQLGGSHAATPKQIRELMKVDGLTNDEVKSHLQKYRLHTRRPSPAGILNGKNLQQPQFVVVEGIWIPPPEYATAATTVKGEMNGVSANRVYAPVASVAHPLPPATVKQSQGSPSHSEDRGSQSGNEKDNPNSATSSSSTHTTTASAAL